MFVDDKWCLLTLKRPIGTLSGFFLALKFRVEMDFIKIIYIESRGHLKYKARIHGYVQQENSPCEK